MTWIRSSLSFSASRTSGFKNFWQVARKRLMEAFGILGFVFGLLAFVRLEKLTKTLKEKNILESDYKDE